MSAPAIPVLWRSLLWVAAAEVLGCIIPILQLLLFFCGSERGECRITSPLFSVCAAPQRWGAGRCNMNCFFCQIRSDVLLWLLLSQVKRFWSQLFASVLPTIITSLLGGSLTASAAAVRHPVLRKSEWNYAM